MYKFRDERINFCFEAYKQSTTGKFFLQHIISSFPIEAFVAIDNYNNYSLKSKNKKITVEFNKNRITNILDSFTLTMQEGKKNYYIKMFYSHFNKDLVLGDDINKTLVIAGESIQKSKFSNPKIILHQYVYINKIASKYIIYCIETSKSNTKKSYTELRPPLLEKLKTLKSQKEYLIGDKNIFAIASEKNN